MQYLMLVYGNEIALANTPKEAVETVMREYATYTREMQQAGVRVGGEIVHPTVTATTVRVQDGKITTTHGPVAATKEQLGGYYVLNCSNAEEAIAWAARCPGARLGAVEVRPIVDISLGQ